MFVSLVLPETFNDDPHVVILFNVVLPEIFNDDIHVIWYVPFVNKAPLNTAGNLVVLSVDVQSKRPVGFIDTTGFVAFCINFVLSAINNNLVLILLAPNNNAIPSTDVVEGTKYSWPDNKILGSNCVVPLIIVYLIMLLFLKHLMSCLLM